MKKSYLIIITLIMLLLCGLLFACNNNELIEVSLIIDGEKDSGAKATISKADTSLPTVSKDGYSFNGWFVDESLQTPFDKSTFFNRHSLSQGQNYVFASWEPILFGITYVLNGGTNNIGNPIEYTIEDEIALQPPTRLGGYTFAGWYDNNLFFGEPITSIEYGTVSDMVFYAKWIPYDILYVLDGGVNNSSNVSTYDGVSTVELHPATKIGYDFDGWYDNPFFNGSPTTSIFQGSTRDKVFYAKWSPKTYNIVYDLKGGSNNSNNLRVYDINTEFVLLNATKTGYDFVGWFDETSNNQVYEIMSGSIDNISLYAKWLPKLYDIVYSLDGGQNSSNNPANFTIENEIVFDSPTKKGYTFDKWADGNNNEVKKIVIGTTDTVVIYAKWTIKSYSIFYNLDDGNNNPSNPSSYNINSNITLRPALKNDYDFRGWFDNADFEGEPIGKISLIENIGEINLYAKFLKTYKIEYVMYGGINNTNNPISFTEEDEAILYAPARNGYNFNGWFYAEDYNGESVQEIALNTKNNMKLYAKWTLVTYSINYHLYGGEDNNNPSTYTIEDTIILQSPTKFGYTFDGWFNNENYSGNEIKRISNDRFSNLTLYAKWQEIQYALIYHLDGGTNNINNSNSYTINQNVVLTDAFKVGYIFDGWYLDSLYLQRINGLPIGSYGSIDIFAKFLPTYTITYYLNTGTNDNRNPMSYSERDSIALYPAQKMGFTFKGWFDNSFFDGQAVTEIQQGESGRKTFYAKFVENYSINYELAGGINSPSNASTYTQEDEVIFYDPTKIGYSFVGWFDSVEYEKEICSIPQNSSSQITLYAKWEIIRYDISYYLDGGNNNYNNAEDYTVETSVTLYPPIKNGYEFIGWYSNSDFDGITIENIRQGNVGGIELYAKFLYINSISYELYGGTNSILNPISYTANRTIELFPAEKIGYNFVAWKLNNQIISTIENLDGNLELEAVYEIIVYDIIYESFGGTTISQASYTINDNVVLQPAEKEYYSFVAWYDNMSFEGQSIISIEQGNIGDRLFYALFTPQLYEIRYHLNGGVNSVMNPTHYTIFDEITYKYATRNEYIFKGWYTSSNCSGDAINGVTQGSFGEIDLYAKWQIKVYSIEYELFGGTNSVLNAKTYTLEDNIIFHNPTKNEYEFGGWYLSDPRGKTTIELEVEGEYAIYSLSIGSVGDKILYARWLSEEYDIVYNLNGGHNNPNNPSKYSRDSQITLYSPTKSGFTFLGWYNNAQFTGEKVEFLPLNSQGNKVLYAKFSPTYLIQYVLNGGNYKNDPNTYTIETEDIILENPTKPNFIFKGWYDNENYFGASITKIPKGSTGNKVVYAKFLQEYRVTYELNGGTNNPNNPLTFTEEDELTLYNAERIGYVFIGWYNNSSFSGYSLSYIPQDTKSNINLYAKFLLLININYHLNGGENSYNNPSNITVENTYILEEASREGYIFEGWYGNTHFLGEKIVEIGDVNTDVSDLYAKWEVIVYNINYVLNSGLNSVENPIFYTIESDNIVFYDATRNYYEFVGWYDNQNLSGEVIVNLQSGSLGDRTLYANWQPIAYTITYVLNYGVNSASNPASYTILTNNIEFLSPQRQGAQFVAWYDNPSFGGTPVTGIAKGSYGNRIYYAQWVLNNYSITYHLNGGIDLGNPVQYNVESAIVLASPTRPTYTFLGWYLTADFQGEKITSISNKTGNLNLYAKFSFTYVINYMLLGGENNSNNPSSYTELTPTITLLAPTKAHYIFLNWYGNEEHTGEPITKISLGSTGKKELFSKWQPIEYSVIYHLNEGASNNNPIKYTVEDDIVLSSPSKSGYEFMGWYDNSRFIGNTIETLPTSNIANIELFARWEIITYSINYELNGGLNVVNNPIRYNVGSADIILYAPTREHHTFLGWYASSDYAGSTITVIPYGSTEDKYLYARWQLTVYNITYVISNNAINSVNNPNSYNYNDTIIFESPHREYYEFGGWYNNQYYTGLPIVELVNSYGELTLYAKWIPIRFEIIYMLNDGINHLDNPFIYSIETNLELKMASKYNYNFMGWYDNAEYSGFPITHLENMTGNKILYAKFLPSYSITYVLDGGINHKNNPRSYTVEDNLLLSEPQKYGYMFSGWYDNEQFEGLPITTIEIGSTGERTLYAYFLYAYKITYFVNGGENNSLNPTYYLDNMDTELFPPNRTNYVFLGWYNNNDFSGEPMGMIDGQLQQDIELYARWNEWNQYVYFGEYPQSKKLDDVIIDELDIDERGYYLGSDGARYACIVPTKNGNGYNANQLYYFKVEKIKWRIIYHSNGQLQLISDVILDTETYHSLYSDIVWESSTLREWLNNDFKNNSFSDSSNIISVEVNNSINPIHSISSGNVTEDFVFLLSVEDVINFDFGFNPSLIEKDTGRKAMLSDFAMARGAYCDEYGFGYWWLYTPGANMKYTSYVGADGRVYVNGDSVISVGYGIRPTINIML